MTDRHGIGGNSPPPREQHALRAEELLSLVSDTTAGVEVTTDDQEAALDDILKDARQARKEAEADHVAEKKPHDDAAKEVQAAYKPIIARYDSVMEEVKRLLTPYRQAKERAKAEAAEAARREAEEREKAAQAALKSSDDLESRHNAEAELAAAKKLTATANKIDRSATGLRTYHIAKVVDYKTLLLHIAKTDKPALDAFLEEYARKSLPSQLPGVVVEVERRA